MARIRSVKPEFWTSEQIVECSPIARLLFVGLWNFCDDQGIHPASPKTLKMEVFPGDDITTEEVKAMIEQLKKNGLLEEYEAENKLWWRVTGWQHQKIDKPKGKYPLPKNQDNSTSIRRTVVERSEKKPLEMEMEGKGNGVINNNDKTRAREAESHPEDDGEKPHCPSEEISSYLDRYCWLLSAPQLHEILDELDDPPPILKDKLETWTEWICLAIKEASDRNAKNMAYLRKVIDSAREQQIPPGSKPAKAPFIPPPRQARGPYGVSDDTIRDFLKESGVDIA